MPEFSTKFAQKSYLCDFCSHIIVLQKLDPIYLKSSYYHPFLKFISHITAPPGEICNFCEITELPAEQMQTKYKSNPCTDLTPRNTFQQYLTFFIQFTNGS